MTIAAMTDWTTLIGHSRAQGWFASALRQQRLSGSFLLVGSPGVGKRTVANLLARTLLCERSDASSMSPCGSCEACIQVAAGTHPDVVRVRKPDDKSFIPLELLIGRPEARMQEGFCRDMRMRPFRGGRKIAILEDADFLNEEGSNCLLKTLEEPPASAVVLLIGTSEQRQLPTIRSRCKILRLGPLSDQDAIQLLREVHGVDAADETILHAVEISGGDMHVAQDLLSGASDQFRDSLTAQLAADQPDPQALAKMIGKHVDGAGKDAKVRRAAMRNVFSISVQLFRQQLRRDAALDGVRTLTLARLDRSIRALREVDRSANQAILIDCFATDIAAGTTGDRGAIG